MLHSNQLAMKENNLSIDKKLGLYDWALVRVQRFLTANSIAPPVCYPVAPPHSTNKWQQYGLYLRYQTPPRLYVNVPRSAWPTKTRGRVWSYPCYKVDRTAAGILAHEIGHHCDSVRGNLSSRPVWHAIGAATGNAVTGYEPTHGEAFAESMRLFILNPNLLECAVPQRYTFLRAHFTPSETRTWQQVLAKAPPHIKQAAQRWTE